jgi:hypothetical protein
MRYRPGGRAGFEGGKGVEDFWVWWASAGRAAAEAGIRTGGFEGFTGKMTKRVKAMHPGLAWELAPGGHTEHALIVTAAGIPEQRRIAERWYQHSPPVDEVWEYHPAHQSSPSSLTAVLEFGGHMLSLAELRFGLHVDNDQDVIDTVVFHPSFARMSSQERGQVGFLALDWALGEDGVSRWIGDFQTSDTRPAAGVPADGLIETVEALARRAAEPRWALLRGERNGAIVLASLAVPAKWVDHPLMDQHLAVTLPFADQTPEGLPRPASLDQLREMEDELADRLSPGAQAQTCLDSHPNGVMTAHGCRGLLRSMRAPKRNRWRLRDHLLRRILTRGARCLREQCGAHRGERRDGAVPFRRRPGSDAEDLSAGSRSASRSCRGAPSTGNTGPARRADRENSARTSQRATRASRWGPHTAPVPGNPAVLSSSELLR